MPQSPTLSKSDFKLGSSCFKKLWYKKHNYPTTSEGNEYLDMLADGGYMIGKMAQCLYPSGFEITDRTDKAAAITAYFLKYRNSVMFEAAFKVGDKIIRIDILEKKGNSFRIIEVKSKSFNSSQATTPGYFEKSEWTEYIEDIAFQKWVLQEAYPKAKIECEFLLPDKDKTTPIDHLISWFTISAMESDGRYIDYQIEFKGDLKALKTGHILSWINVDAIIEKRLAGVQQSANAMLAALKKNTAQAFDVPLSIACKGCEYKVDDSKLLNGFKSCWGKLAAPSPHILELGRLGNINNRKDYKNCINDLIAKGQTALQDVPIAYVSNEDPDKPYYDNRALYQLTESKEFLLPGFNEAIKDLEYPLHFIDFETSQMAIPYHANMRPYGKVLFQWSCHTIAHPGAEPVHSEWINTQDNYPNREFAHSLMEQLGDKGTIMTWSAYENTQLKDLKNELEEQAELDTTEQALLKWLTVAVKAHKADTTRLCDMNLLALKYYFHPLMGGLTSIKVTLPAVLAATKSERIRQWLNAEGLWQLDANGQAQDPYTLLPSIRIMDQFEKVKDGSGAMRAYQDMMYGVYREHTLIKELYKEALLKYCKLDTLAMVVIWERWNEMKK